MSNGRQDSRRASPRRRRLHRREFLGGALRIAAGGALGLGTLANFSCARRPPGARGVVVLGMDGVDPNLLKAYVASGNLPSFARLMQEGHFSPLGTTWPPQSPTAWSTFITGQNPGGHGVFDMFLRDPADYSVINGMTRIGDPGKAIEAGRWRVPITGSRFAQIRHGTPFWQYLADRDVPVSLFKIPTAFPPVDYGGRVLGGLGTPDLLGEISNSFFYYTDDPSEAQALGGWGRVYMVAPLGGRVRARLYGPPNPFKTVPESLSCPFTAHVSSDGGSLLLEVCGQRILLRQGEWSGWVKVDFPQDPAPGAVPAMVRFYAKEIAPRFKLYVSPLNVDPLDPTMPVSSPPGFAKDIARSVGRFYTQGLPADHTACMAGVLTDEEYLAQGALVWQERKRLFDYAWRRFDGGFLFFYFTLSDLNSHMFWRAQDPDSPAYTAKLAREHGGAILDTYRRMDGILGRVMDTMPSGTALVVMSDHGFAPWRRKLCVNRWLVKEGLLELKGATRDAKGASLSDADWPQTAAFQVGVNGLYLNRKGRERDGRLSDAEAGQLARSLQAKLQGLVDPATGLRPISRVVRREEVYSGPYVEQAPDLVLGFARGYRGFAPNGAINVEVLTPNKDVWSGTHMVDPALAPGILLSNRPIQIKDPGLGDLGRSICSLLNVPADGLPGRDVFS